MKTAFVICTRSNSSRLPNKPFRKINGVPLLEHLIRRLSQTKIPIILAIPSTEGMVEEIEYAKIALKYGAFLFSGSPDDPQKRMLDAANEFLVDNIIRITHDKIFVHPETVLNALNSFTRGKFDYLYSSQFTPGTAFEIISRSALREACEKFKDVEFISYSVKSVTKNQCHFPVPKNLRSNSRLLIDYPEDLNLLETIFSTLGNYCDLPAVISFCDNHPWIKNINRMPDVTVYTCAYNADKWISRAMQSVESQVNFKYMEYIIVDDFSKDSTPYLISRFSAGKKNVKWIRNPENLGLASSSNVALSHAKGKYIIRVDADDYLPDSFACSKLISSIEKDDSDIIYPDFYDGSFEKVEPNRNFHHPAGALFSTRALNHIKFTDGLRHLDGLDLYERAKNQLKIGYLNEVTYFYNHTPGSLSRSDLEKRKQIKESILCQSQSGLT